jgi:hypothetical protein
MTTTFGEMVERTFKIVSLISILGTSKRSLKAWLQARYTALEEHAFSGRAAVKKRSVYVDLGEDVAIVDRTAGPLRVWITGAGGHGKSTLAFELARRANAASIFFPVLVDHGISDSVDQHVANCLSSAGVERIPVDVARKMLRHGLVGVVVDGLSESQNATGVIDLLRALRRGEIHHAIVTSRSRCPDPEFFIERSLSGLDDAGVKAFVGAYVPDETTREAALDSIGALSRGRRISPLLARIAIERLPWAAGPALDDLELVQNYLCSLRSPASSALCEQDFLRACRIAACACIGSDSNPRDLSEDYLRGVLDSDGARSPYMNVRGEPANAYAIISDLYSSGVLERRTALTSHFYDFVHHPIAELIAAHCGTVKPLTGPPQGEATVEPTR